MEKPASSSVDGEKVKQVDPSSEDIIGSEESPGGTSPPPSKNYEELRLARGLDDNSYTESVKSRTDLEQAVIGCEPAIGEVVVVPPVDGIKVNVSRDDPIQVTQEIPMAPSPEGDVSNQSKAPSNEGKVTVALPSEQSEETPKVDCSIPIIAPPTIKTSLHVEILDSTKDPIVGIDSKAPRSTDETTTFTTVASVKTGDVDLEQEEDDDKPETAKVVEEILIDSTSHGLYPKEDELQSSMLMHLKTAEIKVFPPSKKGKARPKKAPPTNEGIPTTPLKELKVDTASSLGYTPVVRGSIVFQNPKSFKSPEVVEIMDDDDEQVIIDLLNDDKVDLKCLTTSVLVETELGTKSEKHSEAAYWKRRMKKAEAKNSEATKLTKKKKMNEASQLAIALMYPLPVAERVVVREALNMIGDEAAIVQTATSSATRLKPYVTRADLQTLRPDTWLTEPVIDYYMHCLRERQNKAVTKKKKGVRRCHFYRTYFYAKVHPTGHMEAPYAYAQVKKWTQRGVPENSIFKCDALFFPCNVGRTHWILIVAFMKEKTIQVFDSLHGNYTKSVLAIYRYILDEYRSKHDNTEMPDQKEWKLYAESPLSPGQENGSDCGVFVCMYADYISNGWPLLFNQSHINSCRERIALGILQDCAVTTTAATVFAD